MPNHTCPECQEPIEGTVTICPECGYPMDLTKKLFPETQSPNRIQIVFVCLLAVLIPIAYFISQSHYNAQMDKNDRFGYQDVYVLDSPSSSSPQKIVEFTPSPVPTASPNTCQTYSGQVSGSWHNTNRQFPIHMKICNYGNLTGTITIDWDTGRIVSQVEGEVTDNKYTLREKPVKNGNGVFEGWLNNGQFSGQFVYYNGWRHPFEWATHDTGSSQ